MTKHQHNDRHHQCPAKTDIRIGRAKHGPTTGLGPFPGRIAGAVHATATGSAPPEDGCPIRGAAWEQALTRRHLTPRATRAIQRP